jgi:hypothetical protein
VINDDFFLAIHVIARGFRVIYEPEAISEELPSPSLHAEVARRSRIGAGNLQALVLLPRVLRGAPLGVYVQAISHSLLRSFVSVLMLVAFVTNCILILRQSGTTSVITLLWIAQMMFYLLAIGGAGMAKLGRHLKLFDLPYHFCIAHGAHLVGVVQFVCGQHTVLWEKVRVDTSTRSHEEPVAEAVYSS